MVRIQTSSGSGSGVIFETQGRTGYVVTNYHVVEGEVQVSVIVNDSTTYRGSVLGTDSVRDLAVLSICCGSFQALPFGNAANLQPGDEVMAIGYALGLPGEATVTRGIVSAVRYDSAYRSDVIQTDAAINPGNSGGPMLSLSGEILGINTFRYDESQSGRPTEGLGFAISGTTVQQQIPTLLASGIPLGRASKGNTLIISVQDIKRVQEIRYLGGNGLHYLVSPSDPEKQLVALLLIIHNQDAARVIITVDEKAAELRGEGPDDRYGVVDVSPENERNVRVVGETHPSENLLVPFIAGSIEKDGVPGLPQGHSVEGWVVFEAPEGIRLTALRWEAGGIVFIGERAGPSAPTPTPTHRPTATPTPGRTSSFGPTSGDLRHDPSDGFIKDQYANVSIADMIVEATFVNPYSAASNKWDYGFIFRDQGNDSTGSFIQVVVTSDRRWYLAWRETPIADNQRVGGGTITTFDTSAGGRNHLRVVAVKERGWLFVNGEFVSTLDLSSVTGAGDLAVITGAFEGNEVAGAVTRFENFQGERLSRRYGPAEGKLEKEPGLIAAHRSGVWTRDLVAEAEFVNPQGSDWDYGFIIRNPEFNQLEVIGLTDKAWWFHKTRDVGDDEYAKVADGYLSDAGISLLSRNHLLIIAIEGAGWLFVNDRLVAKLDLGHNQTSGGISTMGDFFLSHHGSPSFENLNVWAP